jgi:Fe-S cluster assembly protein SufD
MMAERPEPVWMRTLRSQARERFDSMPWPTTSDEEWRRTDVSRLGLGSFAAAQLPPAACPREGEMEGAAAGSSSTPAGVIRFEEGRCTEAALDPELRAAGVSLLPLELALEEFETPLYRLFKGAIEEADNRLVAWHYAAWSHGAFLWIPPGLEIARPFFIDFAEGGREGTLSSPHVAVILGEGSRAIAAQRIRGADAPILCNAATNLSLGDASGLSMFEAQELGARSLYFRNGRASVARDASLRHVDAAFGGKLVKTRMECALSGRGAEAYLDGVYYCRTGQHMDIRTVQRHQSPRATSRAYYKGAVAAGGRTVFQGLIEVGTGASGTDAYLTNRNLILGEAARSDSIPTLKIGNNDVKCSHGSTTGKLSAEELFYLESRGLSVADAREMLVVGYFEDLLASAPESFRDDALARIRERLHAAGDSAVAA